MLGFLRPGLKRTSVSPPGDPNTTLRKPKPTIWKGHIGENRGTPTDSPCTPPCECGRVSDPTEDQQKNHLVSPQNLKKQEIGFKPLNYGVIIMQQ